MIDHLEIGMRVVFRDGRNFHNGTIVRQYAPNSPTFLFHSDIQQSHFHDGDGTLPWGYGYWVGGGSCTLLNDRREQSGFASFVKRIEEINGLG